MFNFLTSKSDIDTDIAEILFSNLMLGANTEIHSRKAQEKAKTILASCSNRQEILDHIIMLIQGTENPRKRYLLAMAHGWSNVSHVDDTIKYVKLYLDNELYEPVYIHSHHSAPGVELTPLDERNIHIADMLRYLGKAYEQKYDFDNALETYKQMHSLIPFYPGPYCHMCDIYIKKNELQIALNLLKSAKKSIYYKPVRIKVFDKSRTDDSFKKVIDKHITDIENKIEKGYVYKPRKKTSPKG